MQTKRIYILYTLKTHCCMYAFLYTAYIHVAFCKSRCIFIIDIMYLFLLIASSSVPTRFFDDQLVCKNWQKRNTIRRKSQDNIASTLACKEVRNTLLKIFLWVVYNSSFDRFNIQAVLIPPKLSIVLLKFYICTPT